MGAVRRDERRRELRLLEHVRCLDCGYVYAKTTGRGTVASNPGCPDCGYLGWLAASVPLIRHLRPLRSAVDHLPHPLASGG